MAEKTGSVTGISGTSTLPSVPPWDFDVNASHPLASGHAIIRPEETVVRILVCISPYTLALLTAVAVRGVVVWRRLLLRQRPMHPTPSG